MFRVGVRYRDAVGTIELPCDEKYLYDKLSELHVADMTNTTLFVETIDDESMGRLQNRFVNLDEFNYLAKRLDSFDRRELDKFHAVLRHKHMDSIKDMINLTFNLDHYTLVQDLSNLESIGRLQYMTVNGGICEEEKQRIDFAAIGKALIETGKGILVHNGVLFENPENQYEEIYDGEVFPQYMYEDKLMEAAIEYAGRIETVYLPEIPLAIDKAVKRLGAGTLDKCTVNIEDVHLENEYWTEVLKGILHKEGLYAANDVLNSVYGIKLDGELDKLQAVMEYAEVWDSESIQKLAANINCFTYLPNVDDYEDMGRFWIENEEMYHIHPDIQDFFMYDEFGKHITRGFDIKFLENSGVIWTDGKTLSQILENKQNVTDEMSMY